MSSTLQFETPENVFVRYEPAGLGTRFLAWFLDQLLVIATLLVLIIVLIVVGASFNSVQQALSRRSRDNDYAIMYFAGLMIVLWGLGSFLYFGGCELLCSGQTVGKRSTKLRVIKSNGFQLDAGSILIRNLFRVVDHLPPMWLFMFISRTSQRAGDMVAGTLVVFDSAPTLTTVRTSLATRSASDAQFRFDVQRLKRLAGTDYISIERLLERLPVIAEDERLRLLEIYTLQLSKKLFLEPPPVAQRMAFLEDLLAAELRRRERGMS